MVTNGSADRPITILVPCLIRIMIHAKLIGNSSCLIEISDLLSPSTAFCKAEFDKSERLEETIECLSLSLIADLIGLFEIKSESEKRSNNLLFLISVVK